MERVWWERAQQIRPLSIPEVSSSSTVRMPAPRRLRGGSTCRSVWYPREADGLIRVRRTGRRLWAVLNGGQSKARFGLKPLQMDGRPIVEVAALGGRGHLGVRCVRLG